MHHACDTSAIVSGRDKRDTPLKGYVTEANGGDIDLGQELMRFLVELTRHNLFLKVLGDLCPALRTDGGLWRQEATYVAHMKL